MAATVPEIINNELNGARICNTVEAALVELGDAQIYAAYRTKGLAAGQDLNEANRYRINAIFDRIYKDHDGPIHQRGETFVTEAGLF